MPQKLVEETGTETHSPAHRLLAFVGSNWGVFVVVGVCSLVAVGSSGAGILLAPADLSDEWTNRIQMVGLAIVALGLIVLAVQRARLLAATRREPEPAAATIFRAGAVMAMVAVFALLSPPSRTKSEPAGTPGSIPGDRIDPNLAPWSTRPPPPSSGSEFTNGLSAETPVDYTSLPLDEPSPSASPKPSPVGDLFSIAFNYMFPILLLALVAIIGWMLRGKFGPRQESEEAEVVSQASLAAEAGLLASLSELDFDSADPREQITAAYHRLLQALGEAGADRETYEAPHEHLRRTLGDLGVKPEALHQLTGLYVKAQFSEDAITCEHRARAADALEASLAHIRHTQALHPART